jgi:antibiotic biosynthesis monooxygenase (ABM) superfamily enzyme
VSSQPRLPADADGPVTTTVTRRVKPGHQPDYEQVLEAIIAAASRFPGHLGAEVYRPQTAAGEYRIVYRFDTAQHLRAWLDAPEHAAWLERAEPHVLGPLHRQVLTGLEAWFTLATQPGPPPAAALQDGHPDVGDDLPADHLAGVATAPLLGGLPLVVRLAVTTGVTVPLMTWVVMPRVTRLLGRWLYPDPDRR